MSAGRLLTSLGLALLPLGSALAAPHIVDLQWDAGGRFAHQAEVPPGKFVEVCGALKPGQQVDWRFQGGAPMDFNIHYHIGKETVYPVKLTAARQAEQTLSVRAAQVHCWMWTNKGSEAATLSLTLSLKP